MSDLVLRTAGLVKRFGSAVALAGYLRLEQESCDHQPPAAAAVTEYAAVYPGLPAGEYTIWDEQDRPAASVVIAGGQVTSCRWPAG